MDWMIASLSASFVFGITIGYFLAKHHFLKEQAAMYHEQEKTRLWVAYLKTLQGGQK